MSFMYFLRAFGMVIVPSSCWLFSMMATMVLPVAMAVLFRVCAKPFVGAPSFSL